MDPIVDLARRLLVLSAPPRAEREEDLPKLSHQRIRAVGRALLQAELKVSAFPTGELRHPGRRSCVLDTAAVLAWSEASARGEEDRPRTEDELRVVIERWENPARTLDNNP